MAKLDLNSSIKKRYPNNKEEETSNTTSDKIEETKKKTLQDNVSFIADNIYSGLMEIPQSIARFPISIAKTLGYEDLTGSPIITKAEEGSLQQAVTKTIFGKESVGTIQEEAQPLTEISEALGATKNTSSTIGGGAFLLLGALDYTTFGGASKAVKLLAKTDNALEVSKIGSKLGIDKELLPTFSAKVSKMTDEKEITNYISEVQKVQKEIAKTKQATKAKIEVTPVKTVNTTTKQLEFDTPKIKRPTATELKVAETKQIEMGVKSGTPVKATKVVSDEMTLLKNRIKDTARGSRVGSVMAKKDIKAIQTEATKLINNNLPVKLRGSLISIIKDTNSVKTFNNAVDKIGEAISSYKEAQVIQKDLSSRKSKLSFIRKISQINQTAFNEIKRDAGITNGLNKATKEQLDKAISLTKERYQFKKESNLLDTPKNYTVNEKEYEKVINRKKTGIKDKIITGFKNIGKKPSIDRVLGVLSTRIANISPAINTAIRKTQFKIDLNNKAGKKILEKVFKSSKKIKKASVDDYNVFNFAWNAGDYNKVLDIAKKYNVEKDIIEMRSYFDDVFKRAKEAGIDLGYTENYLPRKVNPKKADDLFDYLNSGGVFERAIKSREKEIGRVLTEDEKAKITGNILKGYDAKALNVSSGGTKKRLVENFTSDIDKYYLNPLEAANQRIEEMNNLIEVNQFFKGKVKNLEDGTVDWANTVGNYVKDLNLSAAKEKELRDMLTARFSYRGSGDFVRNTKNLIYITHMNNFLNAITQTGDLAWSLYENGIMDTIYGAVKSFTKGGLKREDVGISKMLSELESGGILGDATNAIFKLSLIDNFDKFGKETFMNALAKNYQRQAKIYLKSGKEGKGIQYIKKIFGEESDVVIKDFVDGKRTEDFLFATQSRLSDFQPITLSEVPEAYLKHPNGRIFFALKTFTIKQLDIFRREVFQQLAKKETRDDGVKNLIRLSTTLIAMNVGTDVVKDIIQGKEIDLKDTAIDNLLSIIGLNRYAFDTANRQGVGQAALNVVLPPGTSLINDVASDIKDTVAGDVTDFSDLKSPKYFPLIGKLFYQWVGKGSKSTTSTTNKSTTKNSGGSSLKINR